jgi:hypothetical protein
VAPENERYHPNGNPRHDPVPSACPKQKEKEGTAEKNGTPKGRKANEWKVRIIAETFKNHFVHVPRD